MWQRERVTELKARQITNRKAEVDASRAVWEFERDSHIETLARQRIMLKDVAQRRQELVRCPPLQICAVCCVPCATIGSLTDCLCCCHRTTQ